MNSQISTNHSLHILNSAMLNINQDYKIRCIPVNLHIETGFYKHSGETIGRRYDYVVGVNVETDTTALVIVNSALIDPYISNRNILNLKEKLQIEKTVREYLEPVVSLSGFMKAVAEKIGKIIFVVSYLNVFGDVNQTVIQVSDLDEAFETALRQFPRWIKMSRSLK